MALRVKLGLFNVCVMWLLCPRNLRSHAALVLWWSRVFYHFFLLGFMGQYSSGLTQICTKIRDQDEIWMRHSNVYCCKLLLCNLPKITLILSSIMANALFIEMKFPHGKHMPSVDLLCTAHQRWAVSSLSAPTCLGFFLEPVQQCGGSCTMGESPVQSACMLPATFSGHFPTYWKNWSGHWWFNFFYACFYHIPNLRQCYHCYDVWEKQRGSADIVTCSWKKWSLKITAFAAWNSLFPRQELWTNTQ